MKIRDRIKSLRRVKASDLAPNPKNWRTHTDAQANAMRGILADVGYAGAALARETPDGLQLIDGHLRAELTPDQKIPVLVLDVTEAEADKILATFDPIGSMAETNTESLAKLLSEIGTESDAVQAMLDELAAVNGIDKWDIDGAEMPGLPSGDREPIQQMTFTLTDEQAADVKSAMESAKKDGPFVDTGNENSNGNALARVVEAYLGKS